MRKHFTPGVALGVIAIVLATCGSAVAGSLITSAKIKDGTIQNKDIKKGTIALDRMTPAAQAAIKRSAKPGDGTGATGATGANGAQGAPGTTVQASPGNDAHGRQLGRHQPQHGRLPGRVPALRPGQAAARQGRAEPHGQGRHREGRLRQ